MRIVALVVLLHLIILLIREGVCIIMIARMEQSALTAGEQEMLALHDLILSLFKKDFGEAIIGVNFRPLIWPLISECWVTVLVKQKVAAMDDLAVQLEQEFMEEFGRFVLFEIKRPWRVATWISARLKKRA